MNGLDYAVVGAIGVSALWGLWRGAAREVFSVAAWVLAFVVANHFAERASAWLPASLEGETSRYLVAVVALFVLTLVVTALVGRVLASALAALGLGAFDRLLGIVFGLLRGVFGVLVATMLAGMTPLPQSALWQTARTTPLLVGVVEWARPSLPQAFASRIRYD